MDFNVPKFQMNFSTLVKTGTPPIIVFIFTIILFIPIISVTYHTDKHLSVWIIAVLIISFNFIPSFILYLNYYINDKGKYIEINTSKNMINIGDGLNIIEIQFKDIEIIKKYYTNKLLRVSYRSYYYYRIELKDSTFYNISRVTIEKFENKIDEVKFDYIDTFFPFIRK